MKNHQKIFYLLLFLLSLLSSSGQTGRVEVWNNMNQPEQEECTIGVANGNATSDGRPLLWKTRDYSSAPDNEVKYNISFPIHFISVSNAGTSTYPWMGVNEHGFAILNSVSSDLPSGSTGPGNGSVMRWALGNCRTIEEFEDYLNSTNLTGRTTQANFGVIDSTGTAAIFETAGNVYWKFDASNSPDGYIVRTNFAINGGGEGGIERYDRTTDLINDYYTGDSLNYKSILRYQMRDFSDFDSEEVPVPFPDRWIENRPFGYIYSYVSICRSTSVSASVIHGVLPTEPPGLTTMWTILGQPATSVALSYWPVGNTPVEADGTVTSALCDISRDIRNYLFDYQENTNYIDSYKLIDWHGGGLWKYTFPLEDSIFAATEDSLTSWRNNSSLLSSPMLDFEAEYAAYALSQLESYFVYLNSGAIDYTQVSSIEVYPNPFVSNLNIRYNLSSHPSYVRIEIYSITGSKIETILHANQTAGNHIYNWSIRKSQFPEGIYFLTILINNQLETHRIIKAGR